MYRSHPKGLSQQDPIDLTAEEDVTTPSKKRFLEPEISQTSHGMTASPIKKKKTDHGLGEKRLRRFRKNPPQTWHDVFRRATNQRFYVLQRERCGTKECPEERVEMAGSTGNIYSIHIAKLSSCNCPHAMTGHECKHVIYVMSQVLRAPLELTYQLALVSSELRAIFEAAPPIAGPASAPGHVENQKRKKIEGDCPICYSELDNISPESITWCQAICGQNMHQECLDVWIRQGKRTCPMCRSPWHEDMASMAKKVSRDSASRPEGYVNIADQLGISLTRDESTYSSWYQPRRFRRRGY